jgi:hypothetical protein
MVRPGDFSAVPGPISPQPLTQGNAMNKNKTQNNFSLIG